MSPRGVAGCVFRFCVIVAVILESNNAAGLDVATVIAILKTAPEIIKEIADIWGELGLNTTGGLEFPLLWSKERDVMDWIGQVSHQLDSLEQQHAMTVATLQTLHRNLKALPNIIRVDRNLDMLEDLLNRVDSADTELKRYIQRGYSNETEDAQWLVERHTLEDFASAVVSHKSSSIRGILERIHFIAVRLQGKGSRLQRSGIFSQLAEVMHVPTFRINFWPTLRSVHQSRYDVDNGNASEHKFIGVNSIAITVLE